MSITIPKWLLGAAAGVALLWAARWVREEIRWYNSLEDSFDRLLDSVPEEQRMYFPS
jgi:hypothetical protein